MKFYQIDGAVLNAIEAGDKALRIRVEIDFLKSGVFQGVFEKDILQAERGLLGHGRG